MSVTSDRNTQKMANLSQRHHSHDTLQLRVRSCYTSQPHTSAHTGSGPYHSLHHFIMTFVLTQLSEMLLIYGTISNNSAINESETQLIQYLIDTDYQPFWLYCMTNDHLLTWCGQWNGSRARYTCGCNDDCISVCVEKTLKRTWPFYFHHTEWTRPLPGLQV